MGVKLLLGLAAGLVLGGCGGGGSSGTPQTSADLVTYGTITRFGSVYANGAEYASQGATVTMNDAPAHISDLRIGHVVSMAATVRAPGQPAVARTIACRDVAEGPISDFDPDGRQFALLGQDVFLDEMTVFENMDLDALANGAVVQVMGLERHQNRVQATYVRRVANAWSAGMLMQVKGEIADVDPGRMRFRIGRQWCDYSNAMLELGGADLGDGLYVEVRSSAPTVDGDLVLDRVRARDRDRDRDRLCGSGCVYELEGYVTDYVSPVEFVVEGTRVTTTAATIYVHGWAETLALDVRVAVSGTYDEFGSLVAEKIVFRLPSVVEIQANVDAVDLDAATFRVLGILVTTNDATLFRDSAASGDGEFWLDDLAIGDRVKARAYLLGGDVVATRLEREEPADTVILKAPVQVIDRPALTLLGVPVTAHDATVFEAADKSVIGADAFFDLVRVGTLVRAVGVDHGATIMADRMSIRDCETSCL